MTWLDITVKKWIDIWEHIQESDIKTLISYLYDIDFDELDDMPYDEVIQLQNSISFLSNMPPKINKDKLEVNGFEFHLVDFNKMEFGSFIDMEYYLTKDDSWIVNMPNILQILFRQVVSEETELHGKILEPYYNFGTKRTLLFNDILLVDVWGSISKYLEFREKIFSSYEGMFSEKEKLDDVDTTRMTAEERKELDNEKRINKWGYELLLMKLANNDPLKIRDAMELQLTMAFNLLAMMYELKIGQS
jgi:hypothetical protein